MAVPVTRIKNAAHTIGTYKPNRYVGIRVYRYHPIALNLSEVIV